MDLFDMHPLTWLFQAVHWSLVTPLPSREQVLTVCLPLWSSQPANLNGEGRMQRRGGYLKMFLEKEGVDNSTRAAETLALAWGPAARLSAETRHG